MSILSGRMPTIKQLQCFVSVAQELNFRRAAERLNKKRMPYSPCLMRHSFLYVWKKALTKPMFD